MVSNSDGVETRPEEEHHTIFMIETTEEEDFENAENFVEADDETMKMEEDIADLTQQVKTEEDAQEDAQMSGEDLYQATRMRFREQQRKEESTRHHDEEGINAENSSESVPKTRFDLILLNDALI